MILGRNAGLWASFVQAALNVLAAAVVVSSGHDLTAATAALFVTLNAFGAITVGLIANASDPTTAPTFAMTTTAPIAPSSSSSSSSTSPIRSPSSDAATTSSPSAAGGDAGAADPSAGGPAAGSGTASP